MLVGPTGGGKTTIRTILEKTLIIFPLVDTESATKLDVFQVRIFLKLLLWYVLVVALFSCNLSEQ